MMLKEFAKRSTWIFDVDDCLYTIDWVCMIKSRSVFAIMPTIMMT